MHVLCMHLTEVTSAKPRPPPLPTCTRSVEAPGGPSQRRVVAVQKSTNECMAKRPGEESSLEVPPVVLRTELRTHGRRRSGAGSHRGSCGSGARGPALGQQGSHPRRTTQPSASPVRRCSDEDSSKSDRVGEVELPGGVLNLDLRATPAPASVLWTVPFLKGYFASSVGMFDHALTTARGS